MREKVSNYFDVTLACKDGERISAQFCYNLSIHHCTSDLGGAGGQAGSLQEQMAAEGLSFYRKILSTAASTPTAESGHSKCWSDFGFGSGSMSSVVSRLSGRGQVSFMELSIFLHSCQ